MSEKDFSGAPSPSGLASEADEQSSAPAERWLRHDHSNHAGFAAAMMACQVYAPSCSDAGECALGGDCFDPAPAWKAVRTIRALASQEDSLATAQRIRRAATLLAAELMGERPDERQASTEGRRANPESTGGRG